MGWIIEIDPKARKELDALPRDIARRILAFLYERLRSLENPRKLGEPLHGKTYGQFWKYRVGDYRLICDIQDQHITVTVIRIGHRSNVYQ
jgi:mRNA interferase RelE/StbE